jgi:CheY-like chemotaxis protein
VCNCEHLQWFLYSAGTNVAATLRRLPTTKMPRILIVDDHPAARTTLRELLDWHSFQVCGDAQNGKEAIEKVVELKPEIVLMDINMPVLNGIAAAQEIRRIAPSTKIVFLTVNDGPGFKAGTRPWAHGFVSKSEAGKALIPTLERIAGITANEVTIECPHCKVMQNIHVAARTTLAKKERQYISCIDCGNEFDVKVPDKIVGGPFVA